MTFISENGGTMKKAELEHRLEELKKMLDSVEGTQTEVYSRIVGYYRSVKNWNAGKRHEYSKRKMYTISAEETVKAIWSGNTSVTANPKQEKALDFLSQAMSNDTHDLFAKSNSKEHIKTQSITKYMLFI